MRSIRRFCRRLSWLQLIVLVSGAVVVGLNVLKFWQQSHEARHRDRAKPVFEVHHLETEKPRIPTAKRVVSRFTEWIRVTQRAAPAPKRDKSLDSLHISIKTGLVYHQSRLSVLLETWFNDAPEQTYFITDTNDETLQQKTGGHLIVTKCGSSHSRASLCCKAEQEFEVFYQKKENKRWFCHVDDDTYLNVPELLKMLSKYDSSIDYYIGKSSIGRPLEISLVGKALPEGAVHKPFWFATGGAGYCISRSLLDRMESHIRNGGFMSICDSIRLPDDVAVGFLSECILGTTTLTQLSVLHSHLKMQSRVHKSDVKSQITFSYGKLGTWDTLIPIDGPFSHEKDPTRFKSFYCLLHPKVPWCPPYTENLL